MEKVYREVRMSWTTQRRLPDSIAAFMLRQEAVMPATMRTKLEDTQGLARTAVFDTHPSDGDRIRRARQADEPGVFHLEYPAQVLFSNFEVASRQVTQLHYREDLGIPVDPSMLAPTGVSGAGI